MTNPLIGADGKLTTWAECPYSVMVLDSNGTVYPTSFVLRLISRMMLIGSLLVGANTLAQSPTVLVLKPGLSKRLQIADFLRDEVAKQLFKVLTIRSLLHGERTLSTQSDMKKGPEYEAQLVLLLDTFRLHSCEEWVRRLAAL